MFSRILVVLFMMMTMGMSSYIKPFTLNTSVADNNNLRAMSVLDSKIVEYYLNHVDADSVKVFSESSGLNRVDVISGILPDALTKNVLVDMGVESIDVSVFSYRKIDSNKFALTYTKKSDGQTVKSKSSGKPLERIQVVVW